MTSDAKPSLLTRAVDALIRWRWVLLAAALVTTVVLLPVSQKLAFEQSIESLYATEDPHLREFLASRQTFGGDEFVIVAYVEPDLFLPDSNTLTEGATQRMEAFAAKLNQVPGVMPESTQHLAKALRFPYGRATVRRIVVGVLVGKDEQTNAVVLRVMPEKDSPVSRGETIRQIRELAAAHDPPAMVVGEPVQIHDMFRYVEEDGHKLFAVSLTLLALVLLLLLQRVRWVVLPVLVVVVSIVWTEALFVISGLRLSMVSSMLNSLVTIIGVQTAMHVSLYFRDQHRSLPPAEALRQSMLELSSPVWWAVVTTAFGFGVLISSHINPVASFGVMMAIGSLVVLAAITVLLPGCVLLGRMLPEPPPSAADRRVAAVLGHITLWVEHHPRRVFLASLGIVAFASVGFLWLRVETDFTKNFRQHSPIVQSLRFVEGKLGGAGSWEVNFPAPRTLTDDYIERVRKFAEHLRAEYAVPDVGVAGEVGGSATAGRLSKVLAITDGLDLIPERILFKSLSLETRVELLASIQRDFVDSLYNPKLGRMRLLLRAYERQPSDTKLKLITDVERLARETFGDATALSPLPLGGGRGEGRETADFHSSDEATEKSSQGPPANNSNDDRLPHPHPLPEEEGTSASTPKTTGLFVLLAFLIESLMDDQWTSFFLSTVGITSMMWYAFRSLPIGLMSLAPNLFPNVLVIGLMGWIGLPINIATAMIACVSMGLTVDSSIIYIDGYRRERARGLRVHEALRETHKQVGRALVYTNAALMAGFSVLSLSHFIPLVYFGLLVSLAMLGGLIGNLVFLPLLIGWWDGRKESRSTAK